LDNSLIGRWISISWCRQTETLDFYAFDVDMVTDVKDGKVFVDYKDEGVHATPLKSSGWNCSTTDIPRRQHRWCMLKAMPPLQATRHKNQSLWQVMNGNVPNALIQMRTICWEMSLEILMRGDKSVSCAVTCSIPSSDEVLL
jgi:hypothetical protein